jgi:choline dehydrogenase-like flavoprotein
VSDPTGRSELSSVDLLIIGSGPVGAAYARLLAEQRPETSMLMVELGPALTDPPGLHITQVEGPERDSVIRASQGPARGSEPQTLEAFFAGDPTRARPGLHLVGGDAMPLASMVTGVGGMGVYWGSASPRPLDSERIPFIDEREWEEAVEVADRLLSVSHDIAAGEGSPAMKAIREVLTNLFAQRLPEGRTVGTMPVAITMNGHGGPHVTGVADILAPMGELVDDRGAFELVSDTLCRSLKWSDGRVTGAVLEAWPGGGSEEVDARAVVVAAGSFRTPQLLWASGIRPEALGRYLVDHPRSMAAVELDPDVVPPLAPGEGGSALVPFADPGYPFLGLVTASPTADYLNLPADARGDLQGGAGYASFDWYGRTFPRPENGVVFSDERADWCGMPAMTVEFELNAAEEAEWDRAVQSLDLASSALGRHVPGRHARKMPLGMHYHYLGMARMGDRDDATSVCDPYSRVWGFENLFVGGNGLIPTATACNPTVMSVALAARAVPELVALLG